jgi:hypothetical protein
LCTATDTTIPEVTVTQLRDNGVDPMLPTVIKHLLVVGAEDYILFVKHKTVYIKHCLGYKSCPFG